MRKGAGRILGLPVDAPVATGAAVLVTLTTYLLTRYQDLSVWKGPLIAQVAVQAGLGHPPGYPLHTLLGALLARMPGLAPLDGVILLSVVPAALMIVPAASLVASLNPARPRGGEPAGGAEFLGVRGRGWWVAVLLTALFVHPTIWDLATRVEVYALAAFLATWALARLAAELGALEGDGGRQSQRGRLWPVGLGFGLAAAVHPVSAALTATAGLFPLVRAAGTRPWVRRSLPGFLAGGLGGLVPYLWIGIVADRTDRLVWGTPTDATALWHFLSARDFASNVGPDAAAVVAHVFDWIGWSVLSGSLLFVLLGLGGWLLLGRRDGSLGRTPPVALALAVVAVAFNVVWLPDDPDCLGYLAGPYVVTGAGGAALLVSLGGRSGWGARAAGIALLVGALLVAALSPPALAVRARPRDRTARLLAEGALDESPPGAIVLVDSDAWLWPLFYLQEVEGRRPDVVVLSVGLSGSSWFWQRLYRRHPDLGPFALKGPGGRLGRIRRFLDAHAERAIFAENVGLARLGAVPTRGVGWLVSNRPVPESTTRAVTRAIEDAAGSIGPGSDDGTGTLALVSYRRGEALWTLGLPRAAHRAFLAGVPPARRPRAPPDRRWGDIPPLRQSLPTPLGARGLGDLARNLEVARFLAEGPRAPPAPGSGEAGP